MHQVLFRIPLDWVPVKFNWMPAEVPVYAYGAILFVTFVACVLFAAWRAARVGINLSRNKAQDLGLWLFAGGLAGARITYMIQFGTPWYKFISIWEGGIVLMGGIIGGTLAFLLFYRYVLQRLGIPFWQMADLAGPAVCIGIAIGRLGCVLNGCCWGNPANPGCPSMEFPLLTAPSRDMLVRQEGLQDAAGFLSWQEILERRSQRPADSDVRTVVGKVEPDSPAAKAGLQENDQIIRLNLGNEWLLNGEVLIFNIKSDDLARLRERLGNEATVTEIKPEPKAENTVKVCVDKPENFKKAHGTARELADGGVIPLDTFSDLLNDWPRGRNSVQFVVERDGRDVELPAFTPRTIGLHPTQAYESISMVLLLFLLLAFYPFRRHDGQVFELFLVAYAVHRFLDELLRTEPKYAVIGMTLSQAFSVLFVIAAIAIEIYLRRTQPRQTGMSAPRAAPGTSAPRAAPV